MKEKNNSGGLYKNVNVPIKLLDFVILGGIGAILIITCLALI